MIYRLRYCNKDGVEARVDIQKGLATPVIDIEGTERPFILSYSNDKGDKSGMFLSSSADIEIYETPDFNINNLKTSNETELSVTHYINNVVSWQGFIIPDFFSIEVRNNPVITMTASDRLGTLKNVTLSDLPSMVSLRELAILCLNKTGLELPLRTMADFNSGTGTNDFFNSKILTQRLSDTKGRSISCYDILSSILTASNSFLVQRSGGWHIINKIQHEAGSGKLYTGERTFVNWSDVIFNFSDISTGGRRTIVPVASSVGVYHEHGGGRLHPENYDFSQGLTGWTAINGFNAVIENRSVEGYTSASNPVRMVPNYGEVTTKNTIRSINPPPGFDPDYDIVPYLKSPDIPIVSVNDDVVDINVDISAIGPHNAAFRYVVLATKGANRLYLNASGTFEPFVATDERHISFLSFGQPGINIASVKSQSITGKLNNPAGYSISIRVYGSGEGNPIFINFASVSFSNANNIPKGTMYKREQGANYTKTHEIPTVLWGDYLTNGLNGYFYEYPIDDTSSLYLPDGNLHSKWTAYNDPEQLPLLQHVTRQKSRLFSVAHDLLSAEIEASNFDPLAIFVACGKRYTVVSAQFDFFKSNLSVELEEVAFQSANVRDFIYSYFGDGESGIKSIGGISGGGGGGSGGGMTADQVAILSEVQDLAHEHGNKEVLDQVTQEVVDNSLREMLTSESESEATDENLMSALRVLAEIADKTDGLDDKYLSKITPDTAWEIITFVKGIISQAVIKTTELEATGNITSLATVQAQIIKALVSAEIQDMILKGTLSSESFTSGFLGNGFRLKYSDSRWILEVDKIVVRQAMEIFELIVQKITHQGGQVIHSPFGGKLTAVLHGGTYWRCEHDSTDDCIEGAFILCQNFKVGSGNQNPTGQTTFQGVSVKRYWRKVTSAGRGWFNLSVSTAESGSDMPQVGDDVIALGHESNPDWQNAIILASTGGNTPYIAHYAGINTFSLVGKEVVREGNLSGIVDAVFGTLSGYGLYSSNVFLRGVFKLANGDDVGGILGQLQTEVSAIPGQIDLAVKSVPLGLTNLLRNYNADLGLDFWSLNFDTWEQGGFSGYDAQNNVKKIRTGFVEIGQGKYNIELTDGYKVQILFYDGTHAGVQNNTDKINGDSVTAGSTVKYARFALERVDDENLLPGDYGKAGFSLTMGTVISDSGSVILPHIVSITLPQNSYSVQKDGTLTPNTSITLNLSNGTTRQTTINWGVIDTSTVGSFTNSSSNYVIPVGVALTPKPSASIIVNVTAGAPELTIASVVQPSQVTVEQYGNPVMPSTVTLNISDGSTRTVAVAWGSYNTNMIGTYTISGSYDLPAGITGSKPAVSISLNVVAQAVTVVSVTQPGTVYVAQYGTPSLPSTVQLNLSNSTSQNVSVSWSSYNTNTVGTYTLTGSYNLPAGVSGSKPAVSLTLTVTSAGSGVVDLMPIMTARTDLFTTGSDATGNYVQPLAANMDWDMFNSKLSDIVAGTSKLYARYAWGSDSFSTNVRVRKSGSFGVLNLQMQSGGTKISATITDSGSDQFGMYLGGDTIRIYNLELRNDGNAPAWW